MKLLKLWLYDEFERLKKINMTEFRKDWRLQCITDIPQQTNGCDCGIFMMKYAYYISNNVTLDENTFEQKDMPRFRVEMIGNIIRAGTGSTCDLDHIVDYFTKQGGNVFDGDTTSIEVSTDEQERNTFQLSCFFCSYCLQILNSYATFDHQSVFDVWDTVMYPIIIIFKYFIF